MKLLKISQTKQATSLVNSAVNDRLIFRLFDFKLHDYLKFCNIKKEEYYDYDIRGAKALAICQDLLEVQLESIVEVAIQNDLKIDLLVPMITDN